MPVHIKITNAKTGLQGQIIVDRQTITFVFTDYIQNLASLIKNPNLQAQNPDDYQNAMEGDALRKTFLSDVGKRLHKTFTDELKLDEIKDKRLHLILEHVSITDNETIHVHYIFKKDIDQKLMKHFISAVPKKSWLAFLDKASFRRLKRQTKTYFSENIFNDLDFLREEMDAFKDWSAKQTPASSQFNASSSTLFARSSASASSASAASASVASASVASVASASAASASASVATFVPTGLILRSSSPSSS